MSASEELKSARFRREREAAWRELEGLVDRLERRGPSSLTGDELHRLASLYRGAVSSLSVARAVSLDRNLLEYLGALVSRAYVVMYGAPRSFWAAAREFLGEGWPTAARRHAGALWLAFFVLVFGTTVGYRMTAADPELFNTFVDADLANGRGPGASSEELRQALYTAPEGSEGLLTVFASFLFTHNAQVGILCFATGFAAGVPIFFLLFTNGLMLGAFGALYASRGYGFEFWCWVLPHGVTELLAVVCCAAAGLTIARGLVFPGRFTRLQNLAQASREVAPLLVGAALMFLLAAVLEGYFRQRVLSEAGRAPMALATLIGWAAYFGFAGRSLGRPR